jgi:hypothetical protein
MFMSKSKLNPDITLSRAKIQLLQRNNILLDDQYLKDVDIWANNRYKQTHLSIVP